MNPKVACLQIDLVFGDPEANIETVKKEIEKIAASEKPDVIVLPELWTTGYDLTRLDEIADPNGSKTIALVSSLAKTYEVNIVAGSVAKKTEAGVTNTMYVFNRQGELNHEYSKLHLFKLMDEHLYLNGGTEKGLFQLDGLQSAGVICYDIRFPEWIRVHTAQGAEILYVVAEWPLPRLHHWRSMLISRAIENQCFVVACNRSGSDPNNEFAGHSMIIDPWGEILAEAGTEQTSLTAVLQMEKVKEIRKQIPIFKDRLPDFYS
ncbi:MULTISPECIES: carbon-nitrogen family hydrolase [Metabacillus]|uniref:Carbon-nitrogen family hydrolase n=1 Tax=Metabacillus hrfriensis TaxID=3048891 RepID=A0ACD4RGC4_9BACI|nr:MULTISPECIES: carbon-nitrogen family hydrolase [Metabacillus]UAL53889.1 carbon-nitrogen family hydrolase [Metabacillus dongyingensis]UOK59802.1 carbon-nitrogen family hydrolase [Bacillus sp. OVS6]USK30200.1 carbon-nitrogen family hydrolase [Bacillus sp. CMF21]WHZ59446.1 carbon-nitrogen family hydrolase [Metabacillus sp. CT-WN-B3]